MPYIKEDQRELITKDIGNTATPGDLNYLITLALLKYWKANPSYGTLHAFRRDFVTDPKNNVLIKKLRVDFADTFTVGDIHAAAAEAYYEFRARVGAAYEKKKMRLNGDLKEYQEALAEIEKMEK
jgi:hypothetical protein